MAFELNPRFRKTTGSNPGIIRGTGFNSLEGVNPLEIKPIHKPVRRDIIHKIDDFSFTFSDTLNVVEKIMQCESIIECPSRFHWKRILRNQQGNNSTIYSLILFFSWSNLCNG